MRIPRIYLAGAIRDGVAEDIEWRERFIDLVGPDADILNPLAGKQFDPETRLWTIHTKWSPGSKFIVRHDFFAIDSMDLGVFNFTALSEGYPMIGSLIEFGRATSRSALVYSIVPKGFEGHGNQGMFKLHPFLEDNSAMIFPTTDECAEFVKLHIPVLMGWEASYGK